MSTDPNPNLPAPASTDSSEASIPENAEALQNSIFDNEILEVARDRLSQVYAEKQFTSVGVSSPQAASEIPWDIIIGAAIEALIACIEKRRAGGATNPTDPNMYIQMARERRLLTRIMMRNKIADALHESYGRGAWFRFRGKDLVESALDAASNASPQEMQRLINVADSM